MKKRRLVLWLALLVTLALVVLTGCSAVNMLSSRSADVNAKAMPEMAKAPAATPAPAGTAPAITADTIAALEGTLEQVYQNVSPSVVYIEVAKQATGSSLPGWPLDASAISPGIAVSARLWVRLCVG
jgi:hypothetical protein